MEKDLSREILSDIVFFMKYARYLPEKGRRETWDECVTRNMEMHIRKFPNLENEIRETYKYVFEKKVLPSMRALQFGGLPIELNPARSYNCSATAIDCPEAFSEIMFLLLCGCGTGYSVQQHHIKKLPSLRGPIFPKDNRQRRKRFKVADSIEGWADAIKVLMKSYFEGSKDIEFDFRDIRRKGEPLKTSGGIAPGPQPLIDAIHNIRKVLNKSLEERGSGTQLKSIECHDICCFLADAVLAGGVRRSAMISLFSYGDYDMLVSKFNHWWELNPQRGRANNSVVLLRHKIKKDDFYELWEKVRESGSGEPGIVFSNDKNMLINPCQPAWAPILTQDGLSCIGKIKEGDKIWSSEGWTTVIKKWSTGIKQVYQYQTVSGSFCGTKNHKVLSCGEKIEAQNADSIDFLRGPEEQYNWQGNFNIQAVMDGLVLGDGMVHKASNNLVVLNIGEKDNDYFKDSVSKYILEDRRRLSPYAWAVQTTLTHKALPRTWEREIPKKYMYTTPMLMASLLRGLFSANGSICGNRITLKSSSKVLIENVQIMLSALGIHSYYTANKPKMIKWDNGNYCSKKSYDLNISTDRVRFSQLIGFIQSYKNQKLDAVIKRLSKSYQKKESYDIVNVKKLGEEEVFDITVDNKSHTYWTGGINVSNCAEISLSNMGFCNLTEINVADIESQKDLNARARAAAFIGTVQASYTNFHYLRDEWQERAEKDALIGVSMTGIGSGKVLKFSLEEVANEVLKENERIAKLIGINKAARCCTLKPSGTASAVLGTSSGIHAWHAKYYLRRVRVGKEEAIYKFLSKNLPEIIEDDFFKPEERAIISIPIKAPNGAILRTESPIELLGRVTRFNKEWIATGHRRGDNRNNVSVTVPVGKKENEWDQVRDWMWENRDSYNGISIIPYDGGTYVQMPFEEITKKEYEEMYAKLKEVDLTKISESEDNTKHKNEVACGGGACEVHYV